MRAYKLYKYIYFSIVMLSTHCMYSMQEKAVIKYPVIEMNSSFPGTPRNSSISPGPTNKNCQRAHQGLYNEQVDILEEKDDDVKVSLRDVTYKTDGSVSTFWTHKNNIIRLDTIENTDVLQTIPHQKYGQEPTIVLTYPWEGFSVGTRFKHLPDNDLQTSYAIVRANFLDHITQFDMIPHEHAIQEMQQDLVDARQLFVRNINDLITRVEHNHPDHVIPYVWGGSSFIHTYKDAGFYEKDGAWERKGVKHPYTGYDCSEFVMRMAKVAGIDFPWKTTTAIQHGQRALTTDDILEDGDLIWIQGHVMIVSSIQENELIEARGYASGFGCVHRIRLSDMFEDVATYDDLLERYHARSSLNLKNKQGAFYLKADKFMLLKLIN